MLQDIWQDIRYGVRMLRKSAVFTLVAVLTLSLGIGANAAIFSVVNAFLLRPMPVKDADRLVVVAVTHEGNYDPHNVSHADYLDYRQGTDVFEDWAGYYISFVGIAHGGRAERSTVLFVTPGYFQMLGVPAKEGRVLLPQEGEKPGADPVVVLGHTYWMNKFGGAKDIVDRVVTINGRAVTVVGVVPEWFHGTYALTEMDAYMPLGMAATLDPSYKESLTKRDNHDLRVLARLKPGVSVSQAQAALDVVAKRLETQYPETNKTVRAHAFLERLARPEPNNADKSPIVAGLFLLLTGLVLLVACVNVANLLLVRATLREKEMAIRAALGAGRVRLLRQLLIESVLLAAAGAGGGLLVAGWIVRLLEQVRLPGDLPFRFDFQMDVRVFVFVAGVALVAGLGVGLLPALRAGRANLMGVLHEGGRSLAAGAGRHRTRNVLVVSQVAGALVLLVVAALFVRSLGNAQSVDLGFDPKGVMNFALDPMQQGYDETRSRALFEELERRVRALPGVDAVSYAYSPPLGYYNNAEYVNAEGQYVKDQRRPISGFNLVGPDYFTVMRIPLVRGRVFSKSDNANSPRVAIVNEFMAKHLWPGQDPIGKRFQKGTPPGPPMEVVGVSKDGIYNFIFQDPGMYFFQPIEQEFSSLRVLQLRASVPPETLARPVIEQVRALAPELPVYDVMTMERWLDSGNGFFLVRMAAVLAGSLGALGMALAIVGVYGVVSYAASQRTHEIGIRVALGAQRRDILRLIVGEGFGLVILGVGLGVAGAFALSRTLRNFLFGISPNDAVAFLGVPLLLIAVALLACWFPARRAARVDPMVALRYE